MLHIMWNKGFTGKAWKILQNPNKDLRAVVKTKHGPSCAIDMEVGDKQGSRLTGRMFAKLMDTLAEELEPTSEGFKINNDFLIAVLLWVDDFVSCIEGKKKQEEMLQRIAYFAIKHKLKWGASKCQVMRIGKHEETQTEWKNGEIIIAETESYKYLGDLITCDGRNTKNLEQRKTK